MGAQVLVMASVCGAARMAMAQSSTWTGLGTDNNWTTPNNWSPVGVPSGSSVTFAGTTRLSPNVNTPESFGFLSFSSGAGAFVLGGSTLSSGSGGSITNNSASIETFNNNIQFSTSDAITSNAGPIVVNGSLSVVAAVNVTGASSTTLSGLISGAIGFNKSGTGTLLISGNSVNDVQTLNLNDGLVALNNLQSAIAGTVNVGDGTSAVASATLLLQRSAQFSDPNATVTITTDGFFNLNNFNQACGTIAMNGGSIATGTGTLTVTSAFTMQASGPTFGGTLSDSGSFTFTAGSFSGRLINKTSSMSIPASFAFGNGMENDVPLTMASGQTISLNGAGLDNENTIAFAGTLNGSGPLTNNASITGSGTFAGSGGLVNNGVLTQSGGNLVLSNTGANQNNANIDLASGLQLQLSGGGVMLTNKGTINLNGGFISGSGTLANGAGGIVSGRGTISSAFSNGVGGSLVLQSGTTNVTAAFTNAGNVQLAGAAASLNGGAITNTGTIQGFGIVANSIANSGTIEALGGLLMLSGTVTNPAAIGGPTPSPAGLIRVSAGNKMLFSSGLATNAGTINLAGGTLDNGNQAMSNTGQINGFGTLASGGLTNSGQMQLSGGSTTIQGNVTSTSGGKIIVSGGSVATFFSNVTMNSGSTFQVSTASTAVFFGNVAGTTFFNGPGTKDFESGVSAAQSIETAGTTSVQQGASLSAGDIRENTLTVNGNVSIPANGTNAATSKVANLSVGSVGQLDLSNNKLIVTSGSVGSWNGSNYDGISGLIKSGRNAGAWNGSGIVTSQSAAGALSLLTTLAVAGAGDVSKTSFGGQSVSPADVLVMYTYAGDANLNGAIDGDDYFRIDGGFAAHASGYAEGDFNYDGKINADDYFIIDRNYSRQGLPFSGAVGISGASAIGGITAVPEPALGGLLALSTMMLSRRRRMG